ncbi:MAG TPA: beta-ketoacyl-ACP synthase 3 [Kiritimatiellia bacterium]|nr:beta-ketoacyl-ACP synthase 3 [Kiritimatiellia bacterium]
MNTELFTELYRVMLTSRKLDELAESLAHQGEVPFYVPSCGHEATAMLAPHLKEYDWLHCHYRDQALALARGVEPLTILYGLLGKTESNSAGRRMPGFPSCRALRILSSPTVVGNSALQACGVAAAVKAQPEQPVVLCSMGDGCTQEGEVLEALAEAVRSELPVLFLIQDNSFALSSRTSGRTFYSLPGGEAREYLGRPITWLDGTRPETVYEVLGRTIETIRRDRKPQVVVMRTERLTSHTNSDDHRMYRSAEEIAHIRETADPVRILGESLEKAGVELAPIEKQVDETLERQLQQARAGSNPADARDVKKALPPEVSDPAREYRGTGDRKLSMLEAMRTVLRNQLASSPRVSLYGEDIEDPKGDVFGLTRGLSTQFPDQVRNSPLSESTIAGVSIGRALAGEQPVALLQFADFMPLAYNQLFSEMGCMHWRTNGDWEAPVILMGICGGYRPGLGPFHAQTPVSMAAKIPGVDVFVPSTAADAAGLLNAAFASGRPSIFFYPKNLLNDRTVATSEDIGEHLVPVGRARVVRTGRDITFVSWGSTMPLCERAVNALEEAGLSAGLIDLRTMIPWDVETVMAAAAKTGVLLIVDEDTHTASLSGEIAATVSEMSGGKIRAGRVTTADAYVPYNFGAQLATLPSFKSVMEKAAALLDWDIAWEQQVKEEGNELIVNAIGSSPSDETVKITRLHVKKGDPVETGAMIASVEADKATMDIAAPAAGRVSEIFLNEGDTATVGTPLVKIHTAESASARPVTEDNPGRPILNKRAAAPVRAAVTAKAEARPVILSSICSQMGSRVMTNEELVKRCPGWSPDDIVQRTGIMKRHWIGEGESVLTLAVAACRKLLKAENIDILEIDALICSTGTPLSTTPSLACRILKELSPESGELLMQAHDINAACSGYLYALQQAYDMLTHNPAARILVVTAETLSPILNASDPGTYFLFGDAATASLVSCERRKGNINARVSRPALSALGEAPEILYVPSLNSGEHVMMDGLPVFRMAVKKMIMMLERACAADGITVSDLDMIVPHQANERIIEAIRKAIKFPTEKVYYFIRDYGNTSSNTIPLALESIIPKHRSTNKVGLTAFGGGFTFAAGILEVL